MGYKHEVVPLLQVLSHKTRAYICNPTANFLHAFLVVPNVKDILGKSETKGELKAIQLW